MQWSTPTFNLDIFTDNHFTSFGLLSLVGVSDIQPKGVLNKNRLRKCTIIGQKQLQKKERNYFEQRRVNQTNKQCNLCGW